MELRQLNYFVRVAENGSFSRAAIALQVAQPALSRQIAKLEEELGVPLMHRHGRGVTLTAAGDLLLASSRDVLNRLQATTRDIAEIASRLSGSAVVGLPPTVGRILSAPLARMFKQHFPAVKLQIVEGFSGNVLEWLSSGRIDVGVLYSDPGQAPMIAEPLVEEELMLIGAPGMPGSPGKKPIAFRAMARLPLILPSRPHGLRRLIDTLAADSAAELNVVMEVDSLHTMLELTRERLGFTILPAATIDGARGALEAFAIAEPNVTRTLYLATGPQRSTSIARRELARLVRGQIFSISGVGLWRPAVSPPP
ncbi:LysR family transcriptional regulator [Chelativorans salis]|uniref:LysR substrate-binding domain-containing protein n=1 Tax=Chelativorans salis TaxID=2978478 RepID=A0ABT2LQC0_9HYPH|nr:LysR substrate-binding domain-containing protein [Chelativorans sp. EGI FJ00035]MCT7376745.1 LysR substrate-binding domain-containing protein [Chelativorans sp. EGI FJ00035]